jgi:hypothetical protein
MGFKVKRMKYYSTMIENRNGSESTLLSVFSKAGVNYLAFNAEVVDTNQIKFTLYPVENEKFIDVAEKNGLILDGPYDALHIEGDDESGACADVFDMLAKANLVVNFSFGIADIKSGYGIIIYTDEKDIEKVIDTLKN